MTAALAVQLTVEELRSLVRDAVKQELALVPKGVEPSEVLTRKQAAELLSVNPHQMPKLIKEGLPAHRFGVGGKQWRFRRSEILQWLAKRER